MSSLEHSAAIATPRRQLRRCSLCISQISNDCYGTQTPAPSRNSFAISRAATPMQNTVPGQLQITSYRCLRGRRSKPGGILSGNISRASLKSLRSSSKINSNLAKKTLDSPAGPKPSGFDTPSNHGFRRRKILAIRIGFWHTVRHISNNRTSGKTGTVGAISRQIPASERCVGGDEAGGVRLLRPGISTRA